MASAVENKSFTDNVVDGKNLLDNAIEWIKANLDPEDVFDHPALESWAKSMGFIEEEG